MLVQTFAVYGCLHSSGHVALKTFAVYGCLHSFGPDKTAGGRTHTHTHTTMTHDLLPSVFTNSLFADVAGVAYTQPLYSDMMAEPHTEYVFQNGISRPRSVSYPPNMTGLMFDGIIRDPMPEVVVQQEMVMFGLPRPVLTRLQIRPDGTMDLPPSGTDSIQGDWVRCIGLIRDRNKNITTVYIRSTYFNKETGHTMLGDVDDYDVQIIRDAIKAEKATQGMKGEHKALAMKPNEGSIL